MGFRERLRRLFGQASDSEPEQPQHAAKEMSPATDDSSASAPPRVLDRRTIEDEGRSTHESSGGSRSSNQLLLIGFDFGTSGSKVAFRDFAERRETPNVIDFGTTTPGFSRFALPSTVVRVGERVLVGSEAEAWAERADRVIRSPKAALLAGNDAPWKPGHEATEAEVAAALVIADGLRRTFDVLEARGQRDRRRYVNLDVPVAEISEDGASSGFRRALSTGLYLATNLTEDDGEDRILEAWEAARDAKPAGELLGEAHAVMQGIETMFPVADDQIHVIMDVGAGTLDMGVFKKFRRGTKSRISFWAASTYPKGCDELDRAIARDLFGIAGASDPKLLARVRLAKVSPSGMRRERGLAGRPSEVLTLPGRQRNWVPSTPDPTAGFSAPHISNRSNVISGRTYVSSSSEVAPSSPHSCRR